MRYSRLLLVTDEHKMLRYLAILLAVGSAHAAEPEAVPSASEAALAACAAMQERFVGTECSASKPGARMYRLLVKAATPDAMRVVFMRSLDVADALCQSGNKVELTQQLETSAGNRIVRWEIDPPGCGVKRLGG